MNNKVQKQTEFEKLVGSYYIRFISIWAKMDASHDETFADRIEIANFLNEIDDAHAKVEAMGRILDEDDSLTDEKKYPYKLKFNN